MKIDPYYQWHKCWPMSTFSGDTRFPEEGASNDSVVVENGNFQRFRRLFFRNFRDEASVIKLVHNTDYHYDLRSCHSCFYLHTV